MDNIQRKNKLLEKSLSIIKKNIDDGIVKTEVFSLRIDSNESTNHPLSSPNYMKVSINRKEYNHVLDTIMDYFIQNEWYEDCAVIKSYKDKLKELYKDEESRVTTPTTETVKAEL